MKTPTNSNKKITHTTNYNIGDYVYWIEKSHGIFSIEYSAINSIKIGGKNHEKYELSYTTRSEADVFEDFEEAKAKALISQKLHNKKALKIINEYKDRGKKI